jgi:hypothetical protein
MDRPRPGAAVRAESGLFLAFAWITGCFGTALWIAWKVKAPLPPALIPPSNEQIARDNARMAAEAQAMMGIERNR